METKTNIEKVNRVGRSVFVMLIERTMMHVISQIEGFSIDVSPSAHWFSQKIY